MAQTKITTEIRHSANTFRTVMEAAGVPIEKVILFGSRAKNTARDDSDIDLAIVSPLFGKDLIDELTLLFSNTHKADIRIEPYPLSVTEYEQGYSPIVHEIRTHGMEIVP